LNLISTLELYEYAIVNEMNANAIFSLQVYKSIEITKKILTLWSHKLSIM